MLIKISVIIPVSDIKVVYTEVSNFYLFPYSRTFCSVASLRFKLCFIMNSEIICFSIKELISCRYYFIYKVVYEWLQRSFLGRDQKSGPV